MKRYIVEFFGTFFLVLVIALTGNPIAIGAVLAALVYMGGYISGANYNPAVTLCLFLAKRIKPGIALRYALVQLSAGIIAAGISYGMQGNIFMPALSPVANPLTALFVEILFTFLLASVVMHVAATAKTKGNQYYGLAIGFTVIAIAYAGGPISGGVFNPAVGVGPIVFDISNIGNNIVPLIIYSVGPSVGGILAAIVYKELSSSD